MMPKRTSYNNSEEGHKNLWLSAVDVVGCRQRTDIVDCTIAKCRACAVVARSIDQSMLQLEVQVLQLFQ